MAPHKAPNSLFRQYSPLSPIAGVHGPRSASFERPERRIPPAACHLRPVHSVPTRTHSSHGACHQVTGAQAARACLRAALPTVPRPASWQPHRTAAWSGYRQHHPHFPRCDRSTAGTCSAPLHAYQRSMLRRRDARAPPLREGRPAISSTNERAPTRPRPLRRRRRRRVAANGERTGSTAAESSSSRAHRRASPWGSAAGKDRRSSISARLCGVFLLPSIGPSQASCDHRRHADVPPPVIELLRASLRSRRSASDEVSSALQREIVERRARHSRSIRPRHAVRRAYIPRVLHGQRTPVAVLADAQLIDSAQHRCAMEDGHSGADADTYEDGDAHARQQRALHRSVDAGPSEDVPSMGRYGLSAGADRRRTPEPSPRSRRTRG